MKRVEDKKRPLSEERLTMKEYRLLKKICKMGRTPASRLTTDELRTAEELRERGLLTLAGDERDEVLSETGETFRDDSEDKAKYCQQDLKNAVVSLAAFLFGILSRK